MVMRASASARCDGVSGVVDEPCVGLYESLRKRRSQLLITYGVQEIAVVVFHTGASRVAQRSVPFISPSVVVVRYSMAQKRAVSL